MKRIEKKKKEKRKENSSKKGINVYKRVLS